MAEGEKSDFLHGGGRLVRLRSALDGDGWCRRQGHERWVMGGSSIRRSPYGAKRNTGRRVSLRCDPGFRCASSGPRGLDTQKQLLWIVGRGFDKAIHDLQYAVA